MVVSDSLRLAALQFLIETSAEKGFEVHASIGSTVRAFRENPPGEQRGGSTAGRFLTGAGAAREDAKAAGFEPCSDQDLGGSATAYTHTSSAKLIVDKSGTSEFVQWAKDSFLFGDNSLYTVSEDFRADREGKRCEAVLNQIRERRNEAWASLGIVGRERVEHLDAHVGAGVAMVQRKEFSEGLPCFSRALTASRSASGGRGLRTGDASRSIPLSQRTIEAYIEGGNFMSNGAPHGRRVSLIGLDHVAATQKLMSLREGGREVTTEEARAQIEKAVGHREDDTLLFVEQPSYHIDCAMQFVGERDVIVSQSPVPRGNDESSGRNEQDQLAVDVRRLEDCCAKQLEGADLTVHRKPWVSTMEGGFNLLNGEYVKTQSGTLYITNGVFGADIDDAKKTRLEEEVRGFFEVRGIDVAFLPGEEAKELLQNGGGVGCLLSPIPA